MNQQDLVLVVLSENNKEKLNDIWMRGMKGDLDLYYLCRNNQYYKLTPSEIQNILKDEDGAHIRSRIPPHYSDRIAKNEIWANKIAIMPLLTNKIDHQNQKDIQAKLAPYLDEKHPNHSSELALALLAWMDLYSNENKQPTSVEKQLKRVMENRNIEAINDSVVDRIKTVITPNNLKIKNGSPLSLNKTIPIKQG